MNNSKLFLEKMCDTDLRKLISEINDFERLGATNSKIILKYADTWYSNTVGIERLMRLTIDVYREAAERWLRQISVQ